MKIRCELTQANEDPAYAYKGDAGQVLVVTSVKKLPTVNVVPGDVGIVCMNCMVVLGKGIMQDLNDGFRCRELAANEMVTLHGSRDES